MQESTRPDKKFFVPEVIQTSEMDCGPASLKALLEGYGIYTSYGRLREACQTSVDGTSIDSIEDLAVKLGLDAEQIMLPYDHVLLEGLQALPALVVTRTPNGLTHFVVAWSTHSRWIQVMDPGIGRRWVNKDQFIEDMFKHTFPVPVEAWREWAGTPGFLEPLRKRMSQVGVADALITEMQEQASKDRAWGSLAALDAAVRLVDSLVKSKAIEYGEETGPLIQQLFLANCGNPMIGGSEVPPGGTAFLIPSGYWSVTLREEEEGTEKRLNLHGAVLVRVYGRREKVEGGELAELEPLAPELAAILAEPPVNIEKQIWDSLKQDGWLVPSLIAGAFIISSLGVTLQALLLQGLFRIQQIFPVLTERFYAMGALFLFLFLLFLLELPLVSAVQRMGRRMETRMRIAFLRKIPLLGDRYFHSRLTSDMTTRAHGLRSLNTLPFFLVQFLMTVMRLVLTAAGVVWLQPRSALFAVIALVVFAAFGWYSHTLLEENDMRQRTHAGALSRFYLDALQGLLPLRTHGAERSFRREHEGLLVEWMRSNMVLARTGVVVQGVSALLYSLFSAWVGLDYIANGGAAGGGLLLFYWTLNLPVYGQAIVNFFLQYPVLRNSLLRILEPLSAPEESVSSPEITTIGTDLFDLPEDASALPMGIGIDMQQVDVVAGGHSILSGVNFSIGSGEHLAVVGPSGAGKSSLVGILLGWHKPASGQCLVDGAPLEGEALLHLRRHTVWVDPEVQLWNRSLLDNLTYGNDLKDIGDRGLIFEDADLVNMFERLENGMQTMLGEGGGLVSGGEGQRVRLARAMNRSGVRLVILDEPFRGLDREQRRRLLTRARQFWKDATLICITHDVGETTDFGRVLVIENGQVIEDGAPTLLKRRKKTRYAQLLAAEEQVRSGMWGAKTWRRMWIEGGKLTER
jgi:ATP-binding cassette subfamily B protein